MNVEDPRIEPEFPNRSASKRALFFSLFLAGIALSFGFFIWQIYFPHTSFSKEKRVEIEKGSSFRAIAEELQKEGVIGSKWAFLMWGYVTRYGLSIKPGTYTFSSESAIIEILNNLARGESLPNERIITIPEGWNISDIAGYFDKNGIASSSALYQITGRSAMLYPSAKPEPWRKKYPILASLPSNLSLEGFLFPDTYRVYRDASLESIIEKMIANLEKKLDQTLRDEIAKQKKTVFEVITMASLIEEEVRSEEDRAIVSGILWKRLERGIPLQVDATVVYIRGYNHTPLTKTDLASPSPYNTYKYRGLPAGPISNPGLSAIKAAIYPEENPYLYYLSAPDGRTIFSTTLEEHNAAKEKYLR